MKGQIQSYTVYTKDGKKVNIAAENTMVVSRMVRHEIEMICPRMGKGYEWNYGRWVRCDEIIPIMDKVKYFLFKRVPPKVNNYVNYFSRKSIWRWKLPKL